MTKRSVVLVALFALIFGASQNVRAEEKEGHAISVSGNVGVYSMYFDSASGYKFADAVAQGDVTIRHEGTGFSVNLWGSRSIDPPKAGLDFGREHDIKLANSGDYRGVGYDAWVAYYDLDGSTDFVALGGSVAVSFAPNTSVYVELNKLFSTDTNVFANDLCHKLAILTKVGDYDLKIQVGGNKNHLAGAGLVKVSKTIKLDSGVCATPSIGVLSGLKAVDTAVYGGLCLSF